MENAIENYYNMVQQPWGRMFYDILWRQLNVSDDTPLKILDFGSGLGITANHYAASHTVIAVEPNKLLSEKRLTENKYTQITGSIEKLLEYDNEYFDIVICHNVLEYIEDKEKYFIELSRVLKQDGIFSIIKHNHYGRAMAMAIFEDNPKKALGLITDKKKDLGHKAFGDRTLYDNIDILTWANKQNLRIKSTLGIRTFFALSQNNDIKYDLTWYKDMLELELKVSDIDEYKKIAFLNHIILKK